MTASPPVASPRLWHWTFFVHAWTLTGLAFAACALRATLDGQSDTALRLMIAILVVDLTDGTLARRLKVRERMPLISGEILDYIHDLVGLTFVPMFYLWHSGLLLEPVGFPLVVAATLAATLKYGMKSSLLKLGYSIGAPPVFVALLLAPLLHFGALATTLLAVALLVLVLLPIRFPITTLVTTHWQPGWQSITNYVLALGLPVILFALGRAPPILYWTLLATVAVQLTLFPLLLHFGVLRAGFVRRY